MDLGFQEIVLILVVALLVYGGELPKVARSLGRMVAGLKKAFMEGTENVKATAGLDELARDADLREPFGDEAGGVRTVRRVPFSTDAPAPPEVAQEDVSGEPVPTSVPTAAPGAVSGAASAPVPPDGSGAPGRSGT